MTRVNYRSGYRKHRYELIDEPKKQSYIIFIYKELAPKVSIDGRPAAAHKNRARLGFKQYDVILTKK